jgi:Cys-tRNA(Pro)/Cys-tRNA(Cys) deacylase
MKTNAMRLLDAMGISYATRDYPADPDDLSAETVAAKLALPVEQVFKTLVVKGDRGGVCMAVIPGSDELDLKALAKMAGHRKVEMAPLSEVQPLTGYIRGGVTVLGAKKEYDVYLDETAYLWDTISISAGVRGTQILISPDDYIKVTKATIGAISRPKSS